MQVRIVALQIHHEAAGRAGAPRVADPGKLFPLMTAPAPHLLPRSDRKPDPFISGGVSLLVSKGAGGLFYYGGGANYWFRDRIGLRVEFRDHVWSPEGTALHFAGVRIGLSFR